MSDRKPWFKEANLRKQQDACCARLEEISVLSGPMVVSHFEKNIRHPRTMCGQGWRCSPEWTFYCYTVLPNEVVFETDAPWGAVRDAARRVTATLDRIGLKYLLFWSGGKSLHMHVFIAKDEATQFNAPATIDLWHTIRQAMFDYILTEAGFDPKANWKEKWFDWANIDFDGPLGLERLRPGGAGANPDALMGRLVRAPLSLRTKDGRVTAKMLLAYIPDEGPSDGMEGMRAAYSREVVPGVVPLNHLPATVIEKVRAELSKPLREFTGSVSLPPDLPACIERLMEQGWEGRGRHPIEFEIAKWCLRAGKTEDEAKELLANFVARSDSITSNIEQRGFDNSADVIKSVYRNATDKKYFFSPRRMQRYAGCVEDGGYCGDCQLCAKSGYWKRNEEGLRLFEELLRGSPDKKTHECPDEQTCAQCMLDAEEGHDNAS